MKRLIALLLLSSTSAFGALAIDVNVSTGLAGASKTNFDTPAFTTSSGNQVLILRIATSSSGNSVSSITTSGLSWTFVAQSSISAHGDAEIWRASTTVALTGVIATVTMASNIGSQYLGVISFTGADLTGTNGAGAIGAIQRQNNTSGVSHQPTCTLTTTRDQSFVVGAMTDWDTQIQFAVTAGNTMDGIRLSPTSDTELIVRKTTNVSGLTSTTLNFSNAATTAETEFVCVEILAALGASTSASPSKMRRLELMDQI